MTENSIQEMAVCLAPWFWAANNNVYWLSGISEEKKPGNESWMNLNDFLLVCRRCLWLHNLRFTPRNKWANPNAPGHDNPRCFALPKKQWHHYDKDNPQAHHMPTTPPPWCQILALEVGSLKRCLEICKQVFSWETYQNWHQTMFYQT